MNKRVYAISMLLAAFVAVPFSASAAAPIESDPFPATARSADELRDRADALRTQLLAGAIDAALSARDRTAIGADPAHLRAAR